MQKIRQEQDKIRERVLISNQINVGTEETLIVYIGDERVKQVEEITYLGVTISSDLKWDKHLSKLAKTLNFKVYTLSKLASFLPRNILVRIYMSVIQPSIDYAITIWGYTTLGNIDKIQRLQNLCARIILRRFDYVNVRGEDLVKEMNWLNVVARRNYFMILLMFKCIYDIAPPYLSDHIHVTNEIVLIGPTTRGSSFNIYMDVIPSSEFLKKSLFVAGPILWNSLPVELKENNEIRSFKRLVKLYLLGT